MAATLKDLAPAEKQKVARLIKQVVEKEAAIKELQAALAEARAAAAGAAGAGGETDAHAAALEEQNQELARENTRCGCLQGAAGFPLRLGPLGGTLAGGPPCCGLPCNPPPAPLVPLCLPQPAGQAIPRL